jgi:hypothetical protein
METTAIKCLKCDEVVPSKRALRRHLRMRHPLPRIDMVDGADSCRTVAESVQDVSDSPSTSDVVDGAASSHTVASSVQDVSDIPSVLAAGNVSDQITNSALHLNSIDTQARKVVIVQRSSSQNSTIVLAEEKKFKKMSNASSSEVGRLAALSRNRKVIDTAVARLLKAHLSDRTTLSKPTQVLVENLRRQFTAARLPREVYVGIIVAAKHFAGTFKPRSAAPWQRRKNFRVGHVKRKLFSDEVLAAEKFDENPKEIDDASPVTAKHVMSFKGDNAGTERFIEESEVRVHAGDVSESAVVVDLSVSDNFVFEPAAKESETISATSEDQEWCRDVWRSYGTREVQLPSPIGCSASPSAIFGASPMPPSTPVELWSPSSNDLPWGPDSPAEELEEGGQLYIPDWPRLVDENGVQLDRNGSVFGRRMAEWRTERTNSFVRPHPKRRHHLRARRASRERYKAQLPMLVTDWSQGEGFFRPANLSDVIIPSSPESKSSLLQLRRRLLLQKKLPKGCRIQPARLGKRRRVESTECSSDYKSSTCTPTIETSAAAENQELVPDIDLTMFDDSL